MVRLPLKRLFRHKKGYAGILASIFLVLVVLYLYYNMYMVAQNRNLAFQDATSQSQQLDFDRSIERVTISDVTYSEGELSLTIKNIGPIPVQFVRFWAQNSQAQSTTLSFSPPILLDSGAQTSQFFSVGINGEIAFWFVTARGNLISPNAN